MVSLFHPFGELANWQSVCFPFEKWRLAFQPPPPPAPRWRFHQEETGQDYTWMFLCFLSFTLSLFFSSSPYLSLSLSPSLSLLATSKLRVAFSNSPANLATNTQVPMSKARGARAAQWPARLVSANQRLTQLLSDVFDRNKNGISYFSTGLPSDPPLKVTNF